MLVTCGSRKYSYPTPTDGQWKFQGGGGLIGRNFQGVGGCPHEEFVCRGKKFTEKLKARGKLYPYLYAINTHEKASLMDKLHPARPSEVLIETNKRCKL